jgi:hypothetical protein
LPSDAPEINLDEYLNGDLKHRIGCAAPARNLQQLKPTVVGHVRKLQKQPERVKATLSTAILPMLRECI